MKNKIVYISLILSSILVGFFIGNRYEQKKLIKQIDEQKKLSQKHLDLYLLMNQWVKAKQKGLSIENFLNKNKYKTIAIYGMNYVGQTLENELKNSSIIVKYGIDKNVDAIYSDLDIKHPDDELADVDAVIVTAITFYDEIKNNLSGKLACPIISIEDIVYEV